MRRGVIEYAETDADTTESENLTQDSEQGLSDRNARSRANIERIGARFEGVLRNHTFAADGGVRNTAFYSITAAEWPDVKARLAAKIASYPRS